MDSASSASINDDQFALYDRQIRLWGLNVQKRIANASVLLIGLNGCSAEAAKNLILAGTNYLCIADGRLNAKESYNINIESFMLQARSQYEPMKRSVQSYFQSLNPSVKCDLESQGYVISLNHICRKLNKQFIYGLTFGKFGIIFNDLGHYEYSTKQVAIEDGHDNKRARSTFSSSSENLSDKYDHHIKQYVEFMTAVDQDWSAFKPRTLKKLSDAFLVFKLRVEFEKMYNRVPTIDDINTLMRLCSDVLPKETTMTIDKVRNLFDDDYVPSNVIIGGMISQEVTKIVSRIGHPIHNFFLLDCHSCKGLEQCIGL
ncbi:hypothetical protein GJ496_007957 [Pomphorhynchus laevis]|nr:hypothetical protein GJ496_007957 [Pomphorhynchus laevis]